MKRRLKKLLFSLTSLFLFFTTNCWAYHAYSYQNNCVEINPCIKQYITINSDNKKARLSKRIFQETKYNAVTYSIEEIIGMITEKSDKLFICSTPQEFGRWLYEIKYRAYNYGNLGKLTKYKYLQKISPGNSVLENFLKCLDSILNINTYSKLVLNCTIDQINYMKSRNKDPFSFSPKDLINDCDYLAELKRKGYTDSLLKNISKTFLFEKKVEKAYLSYKNYYIRNILAKKIDKSTEQLRKLYADFLKLDWKSKNFNHYTKNDIAGKEWEGKFQEDVQKLSTLINQERLKVKNLLKKYGITKENASSFKNTKLGASLISFEKELRKFSSIVEEKKKKIENLHSQHQKQKIKTYLFFFIIAVGLLLIWNKYFRLRCPNCGSTDLELFDEYIISEEWEHSTKDGRPDRRYKNNKLIQTIEKKYKCNKCNYTFSRLEERTK